jgi:hypothetical protein
MPDPQNDDKGNSIRKICCISDDYDMPSRAGETYIYFEEVLPVDAKF